MLERGSFTNRHTRPQICYVPRFDSSLCEPNNAVLMGIGIPFWFRFRSLLVRVQRTVPNQCPNALGIVVVVR